MLRFSIFLSAIMGLMLTMQSCFNEIIGISGSGQVKSEIRTVADFEEVELNISGDVEITKDSIYSLEVTDYENLLPHISTYVHGNTLIIEHNPKNMNATISGSGNIFYMGSPKLTVNIMGSGTVKSR